MMKNVDEFLAPNIVMLSIITNWDTDCYALERVQEALVVALIKREARRLRALGYRVRTQGAMPDQYLEMPCVYSPNDALPGIFATLEECRRLRDIAAKLPPEEAFYRWAQTIEPLYPAPLPNQENRQLINDELNANKRNFADDLEELNAANKDTRHAYRSR